MTSVYEKLSKMNPFDVNYWNKFGNFTNLGTLNMPLVQSFLPEFGDYRFHFVHAMIYVPLIVCIYNFIKKPKKPYIDSTHRIDDISNRNTTQIRSVIEVLSIDDIKETIQMCKEQQCSLSICGTRHTMGGHTITKDGYQLDMTKFKRVLSYDHKNGLVTVQPGITWLELTSFLDPHGKRPHTQQSYGSFTTGGSLGPNCHGVSYDDSLIESVKSLKLIDAHSNIVECSAEKNKELFNCVVGGYGLFGVVFEITFKVSKNCMTKMKVIKTTVKNFDKKYTPLINNPDVPIKIARIDITNMTDISVYAFNAMENESVIPVNKDPNRMSAASQLMYKWIVPSYRFQRLRYAYEKLFGKPIDWTGTSLSCNQLLYETADPLSKLYCPLIWKDDTHILQEFFVPKERFTEFMDFLKVFSQDLKKYTKNKLLNITIRYVNEETKTKLSYTRTNSYAFVFYWRSKIKNDSDAELEQIHLRLCDEAIRLGGSFYLPYRHHYTHKDLEAAYPDIYDFVMTKLKYDPNEIFSNNWYRYIQTLLLQSNDNKKKFVGAIHKVNAKIFDEDNELQVAAIKQLFVFADKKNPEYEFQKIVTNALELNNFKIFLHSSIQI